MPTSTYRLQLGPDLSFEAEAGPGGATPTYAQTRPQAVAEAPSIPSPSMPTVDAVVVAPQRTFLPQSWCAGT